ncbi:MAG: DUF429 domain-containing protein [Nitrospinota bacterium]
MKRGEKLYVGIDPAGKPNRPTGMAVLAGGLRVLALERVHTDEEIESFVASWGQAVVSVALDGPIGLPRGLNPCCFEGESPPSPCPCTQPNGLKGREAERAMSRKGIGIFYLTKNAFARSWIRRSLDLYGRLTAAGYQVLEVFPYGAKKVLWRDALPRKQSLWGRERIRTLLEKEGVRFPDARLPSDHELDALVGAYVAWLHARGETEAFGDSVEGAILLPASDGRSRGLRRR